MFSQVMVLSPLARLNSCHKLFLTIQVMVSQKKDWHAIKDLKRITTWKHEKKFKSREHIRELRSAKKVNWDSLLTMWTY